MTTVTERVARGAALLDEKRPGWWREIDLAELDLSHCGRCVLGQLFGCEGDDDFEDALMAIGVEWGDWCGFDSVIKDYLPLDQRAADFNADFAALTGEWKRVIEARRSA